MKIDFKEAWKEENIILNKKLLTFLKYCQAQVQVQGLSQISNKRPGPGAWLYNCNVSTYPGRRCLRCCLNKDFIGQNWKWLSTKIFFKKKTYIQPQQANMAHHIHGFLMQLCWSQSTCLCFIILPLVFSDPIWIQCHLEDQLYSYLLYQIDFDVK